MDGRSLDKIFVLDRAVDFSLLKCDSFDGVVLPVSADAMTGVPSTYPKDKVLSLRDLISPEALEKEVTKSVRAVANSIFDLENCPYYKIKQILDVVIEKKIIISRIAALPGEKIYVDTSGSWFSAEGDNSEELRVSAELMRCMPGFRGLAKVRQASFKHRVKSILRKAYLLSRSGKRVSANSNQNLGVGSLTYGTVAGFSDVKVNARIDFASVFWRRFWSLSFFDCLFLLAYDSPINISKRAKSEQFNFEISVCREVLRRMGRLQKIVDKAVAQLPLPKVFFSVNWGRLIDHAIVRAVSKRGVNVVSMQHACVGHDSWTASQYIDWWGTDYKVVANERVAKQLAIIEKNDRGKRRYVTGQIPMYASHPKELKQWDRRTVLYILTGFTRNNTMYENRRLNDAHYLETVTNDIRWLNEKFDVFVRSHPYDSRQYNDSIVNYLVKEFGVSRSSQFGDASVDQALVIIDSPSTVLSSVVQEGYPLVIINKTALLSKDFEDLGKTHDVLLDKVVDLERLVDCVSSSEFEGKQREFSNSFFETYCVPDNNNTVREVVDGIIAEMQCRGVTHLENK